MIRCYRRPGPRSGLVDLGGAHLSEVRDLVVLLELDTHLRVRQQDWTGARTSGLAAVAIGRCMAGNPASLIECRIGMGLQSMGVSGLLTLALAEDFPLEELHAILALCSEPGFLHEAFEAALKWEYVTI